jgi:hypothetical protein
VDLLPLLTIVTILGYSRRLFPQLLCRTGIEPQGEIAMPMDSS